MRTYNTRLDIFRNKRKKKNTNLQSPSISRNFGNDNIALQAPYFLARLCKASDNSWFSRIYQQVWVAYEIIKRHSNGDVLVGAKPSRHYFSSEQHSADPKATSVIVTILLAGSNFQRETYNKWLLAKPNAINKSCLISSICFIFER